jgi:hypothetical protein
MTITRRTIAELPGNPYRLGRHINHDARSRQFTARAGNPIVSVFHKPNNPIALDQGQIGSCTGNAAAKCLSTAPFIHNLTEADAVSIYSDATKIDSFQGSYPSTDTGSDGISVMKVCQKRGYITSYEWAFNLDQALSALMLQPGICGVEWREGMFEPDSRGRVRIVGAIAGGHEVTMIGYDKGLEEIIFVNSWGPDFGVVEQGITGCFRMRIDDFSSLLATGGDVTFPNL